MVLTHHRFQFCEPFLPSFNDHQAFALDADAIVPLKNGPHPAYQIRARGKPGFYKYTPESFRLFTCGCRHQYNDRRTLRVHIPPISKQNACLKICRDTLLR